MALLQISEPGASPDPHQRRIAVGIDLGTTHSLVAAVRHGVAECLPDEHGRVILPSAVRYFVDERGQAQRQVGAEALADAAVDPRNTIVSVKRFMGRGLADVAQRGQAALRVRRHAGHAAAADSGGRQVAGRGVGRDPGDAAPARRGQLRRRDLRRGDHRAGLLRRCAAPGDQGCRAAGRPERAAPDQRADRRGRGLRAGARRRGPVRGLRPGRRHLRHLAAAAVGGRVRGGRHRRRFGARRRRLRSPARRLGAGARPASRRARRRTSAPCSSRRVRRRRS